MDHTVETYAIGFIFCTVQHSIELYDYLNIFYLFSSTAIFSGREWSVAPLVFNIKERGSDCLIVFFG